MAGTRAAQGSIYRAIHPISRYPILLRNNYSIRGIIYACPKHIEVLLLNKVDKKCNIRDNGKSCRLLQECSESDLPLLESLGYRLGKNVF